VLKKLVMIKEGKSESYRSRTKIFHEKNIVKTFSSAHSGYILKYYNSSQETYAYRNGLMMDYNPYCVTLADHLTISRESLSLDSKLHMLAHISNGLRFLTYYKIVHLDLNPSNVLVYDGYLPKIIDFGEAYHAEVVEMETAKQIPYSPGFTLPYCPPEVFTQKTFSSAQDVFSFGVIMFRLLAGFLPFYPGDSLIRVFSSGEYHWRWLLAAERVEEMARPEACELLLQLMGRCVRVEGEGRPLPIWCTIILKEIISYLYS
jgi:serine/threonine protein kinase